MARILTGIAERPIDETPIAILDFETTGLVPGPDRVVEVAVVRQEPGSQPRLVFDTLVNPQRPVAATEIHGITDADVADAPVFEDLAGELLRAISGSVVASYNVYFDVAFLEYELRRVGVKQSPPHFCLMYLRPLLGLGNRCTLEDACRAHGIQHSVNHISSADALASSGLMRVYNKAMKTRGIRKFGDLTTLKRYKFMSSFARDPLQAATFHTLAGRCCRPKSRSAASVRVGKLDSYWDVLEMILGDLDVTEEEMQTLADRKRQLGLRDEEVRALHARAFSSAVIRYADDQWLDEPEREKLCRLYRCLSQLGWAPGE